MRLWQFMPAHAQPQHLEIGRSLSDLIALVRSKNVASSCGRSPRGSKPDAGHCNLAVLVGVRYLWGGSFASIAGATEEAWQSPQIAVAILLTCIGLCAFFAVPLRLA